MKMKRWIAILATVGLFALGGCGATVYPPAARLSDPVPVYLADYGVHSSLILPTPDGQFVEYAFGDWGYAAENHCLPQDAVGALVASNQAALGRRFFRLKSGETVPQPAQRPWSMAKIDCERPDVFNLVRRLNDRYEAELKSQKPLLNPENGIAFVKDTEHYSFTNNCNHLTARLLEQLGCKVDGLVVASKFNVAAAKSKAPEPVKRRAEAPVPGWNSANAN